MNTDNPLLDLTENTPVFPYETFFRYFTIANAADAPRVNIDNPDLCIPPTGDSDAEDAVFAAIKQEIRDPAISLSFMFRYWALQSLVMHKYLDDYITPHPSHPDKIQIHNAVLDVARQLPLRKGMFHTETFLQEVKERTSQGS